MSARLCASNDIVHNLVVLPCKIITRQCCQFFCASFHQTTHCFPNFGSHVLYILGCFGRIYLYLISKTIIYLMVCTCLIFRIVQACIERIVVVVTFVFQLRHFFFNVFCFYLFSGCGLDCRFYFKIFLFLLLQSIVFVKQCGIVFLANLIYFFQHFLVCLTALL